MSLPTEVNGVLSQHGIELTRNPRGRPLSEDDLIVLLRGYDAVIAGPEPYTAKVMDNAPGLRIIARTGVGYDKVDVDAATQRKIYVTWTPIPELAQSMAEQTFALILSLVKRTPQLNGAIRQGRWDRTAWSKEIRDLYPMTLGLLGTGRIGSEVAKRAKAFQMKVIYYDAVRMTDLESALGIEYVPLDDLLERSDVLSIHVPLTPQTKGMVNAEALGRMKPSALIINTARGGIVDESALASALEKGAIGGAALDALTEEPPSERHVFYKLGDRLPTLIVTPHTGIGTETVKAMAMAAAEDVARVLNGQKPKYPLNKPDPS